MRCILYSEPITFSSDVLRSPLTVDSRRIKVICKIRLKKQNRPTDSHSPLSLIGFVSDLSSSPNTYKVKGFNIIKYTMALNKICP